MDNLIKKPASEFIENVDNEEKEIAKACKIVAEANEDGSVCALEIKGNTVALLSMICAILVNMEEYGNNTARNLAMIILSTLEMEKEKND